MALLKNLGTVLSQIKFTRHSSVAPWFVRWWGYSVTGLKGLCCWRLRARDQNLKWPSSVHSIFFLLLRSKTSTVAFTFEQEDTAVQLLFPHSLNQHVAFNPITLRHNGASCKSPSSTGKTNCPTKTQIKNDTNDLHTVAATGTMWFSTVHGSLWVPPNKMGTSLLLCEWLAYKKGWTTLAPTLTLRVLWSKSHMN